MLSDRLRPSVQSSRFPGRAAERKPILFLRTECDGNSAFPDFAERFKELSAHEVVTADDVRFPNGAPKKKHEEALENWHFIESEFHEVCLGLIAEPGSAMVSASLILRTGWTGGVLPGAIALVGYDAQFVTTCLELAGRFERSNTPCEGEAGAACMLRSQALFEWPPIMIFLPADDPALGECAHACRRMRSAGISVSLEIMRSIRNITGNITVETTIAELIDELDNFFDAHLPPYFPKRL